MNNKIHKCIACKKKYDNIDGVSISMNIGFNKNKGWFICDKCIKRRKDMEEKIDKIYNIKKIISRILEFKFPELPR